MERSRIPFSVLMRSLLRTFAFQASWNFERIQSLGALYVMAPCLRYLYRDEELVEAYRRHLEFFNTHPYMASPVLGIALRLETERAASGDVGGMTVGEFKGMIMAPYAAMGDALFWGGLRPLAAGVALFFAFKGSMWAPVIFLLLFNIPHLWIRVVGFMRGYSLGMGAIETITRHRFPDLAIRLKEATVVLLGGLGAYLSTQTLRCEELSPGWGLLIVPAVALLGWLARKGLSTLMIAWLTAAIVLLLSSIGH